MAIGTDDAIVKFGTQDEVTSSPGTVADGAFSKADASDTVAWTNADDAEFAAAIIKCQFDTTMPTVGAIVLYAHLLAVQSTNDIATPDANYPHVYCGTFPIDFGVAADTDFYSVIPWFRIPQVETAQAIDWYIKNESTGQTIGTGWQLWITPLAVGPHA